VVTVNGPEATFDRAYDTLDEHLDRDEPPMAHLRAYKALLETDRPLTRAEMARAIERSGRQTTRVIRELEAKDLVERRVRSDGQTHVFEAARP
jgi:DNA-binding MarR family transcriptional regulator